MVALCALLLPLGVLGCATNVHRVSKLPPEYLAPPVRNAQEADLSKLATPTVSNELIEAGDVVEVTIDTGYGRDRARTFPLRVADDGSTEVPLVGRVILAGLELKGAEQAIGAAAVEREVYRQPLVTVVMKRKKTNRVTVMGAVKEPGVYDLPSSSSSLLDAFARAGSLTEDAGTDVIIRRPPKRDARPSDGSNHVGRKSPFEGQLTSGDQPPAPSRAMRINLVEATQQGQHGFLLEDGDKVMVVKRDPQPVTVIGLVRKPDKYELPANKELRLLDVLGLAGGISSPVADNIHVIRQVPGKDGAGGTDTIVIKVGMREAKNSRQANLLLAQGDVVSVEHTPATVVLETLRSFIRFGVSSSIPLF